MTSWKQCVLPVLLLSMIDNLLIHLTLSPLDIDSVYFDFNFFPDIFMNLKKWNCNGQILTLVKITMRVPLCQKHPKQPTNSICRQAQCEPKEKASGPAPHTCPELSSRTTTIWDHSPQMLYSDEAVLLWGAPISKMKTFGEDCHFYAGYILSGRIPAIREFRPHVRNITTLLLQCMLLWIVTYISA